MSTPDHQSSHAPDPSPSRVRPPIEGVIDAAKARLLTVPPPSGGRLLTFTARTVTLEMIRDGFKGLEDRFPPILTLEQAAELLGLKEQTLRKHLSEGKYPRSSRRGHPIRFMRDLLVHEYMSGGLK
jgi:hypothetical protein